MMMIRVTSSTRIKSRHQDQTATVIQTTLSLIMMMTRKEIQRIQTHQKAHQATTTMKRVTQVTTWRKMKTSSRPVVSLRMKLCNRRWRVTLLLVSPCLSVLSKKSPNK